MISGLISHNPDTFQFRSETGVEFRRIRVICETEVTFSLRALIPDGLAREEARADQHDPADFDGALVARVRREHQNVQSESHTKPTWMKQTDRNRRLQEKVTMLSGRTMLAL